jgi:hypothetical protein
MRLDVVKQVGDAPHRLRVTLRLIVATMAINEGEGFVGQGLIGTKPVLDLQYWMQ